MHSILGLSRPLGLTLLLATTSQASNPVFGSFSNLDCELCLNQVYDACQAERDPTDCLCNGTGFGDTLTCKIICNNGDEILPVSGYDIDANWQLYCTTQTQCSAVEQLLAPSMFEKYCSGEDAGSNGGAGSEDDDEDDKKVDVPSAANATALRNLWSWLVLVAPAFLI